MNLKKIWFKILQLIISKQLLSSDLDLDSVSEITSRQIRFLLNTQNDIKNVFISDNNYKTLSLEDATKFLKSTLVDMNSYITEKYDCDNFSFSLMGAASNLIPGYAFGICWADTPTGKHALNFFIDENFEVFYIEPQTDDVFQNTKIKPYLMIL